MKPIAAYANASWTIDVAQLPQHASAAALHIATVDFTSDVPLTYTLVYLRPVTAEVLVCWGRCYRVLSDF